MKQFISTDIGSYAFDKTAKTITFSGVTLTLKQILLVINATRGVVIYNPVVATLTGTLGGNVLTLAYDTSAHADSDQLTIIVDLPPASATPVPVSAASAQRTPAIAVATAGGSVAAGTRKMTMVFSSDFAGTVLGQSFNGANDTALTIDAPSGDTLAAIPYTITAGSVRIITVT